MKNESRKFKDLRTQLIHANRSGSFTGPEPLVTPIFQTSTYLQEGEPSYFGVSYHRLNNSPNQLAVANIMSTICGAEDAVVTSSGMAAISATLICLLSSGDHILAQQGVYGGTQGLLDSELKRLGIEVSWVEANQPDTWGASLQSNSKLILVEAMTNPLLKIGALDKVPSFAHSNNLLSIIDNTFATPVNLKPIEQFGFDISIHSSTKYLGGHSDLTAGVVLGKRKVIGDIRKCMGHLGCCLGPQDCFLLERSLKTLLLRMQAHNQNGQAVSSFLKGHDLVEKVFYPEFNASTEQQSWFKGFGGMISFELSKSIESTDFLEHLELIIHAVSLGGTESLATCPARTTHAGLKPEALEALGIHANSIRLSVGLEASDDIINDLDQALQRSSSQS